MMTQASPAHPELTALVRRVAGQVRRRRAEHDALRGAFWGALAGVAALMAKAALGPWAPIVAAGLVLAGLVLGTIWGFVRAVPPLDAARLADRAYGLEDRVATALEWAGRADRTPLVQALVDDARSRAGGLAGRAIVRRRLPREVRWFPVPIAAMVVLSLTPPISLPSGRLGQVSSAVEEEESRERAGGELEQQDRRTAPKDTMRRAGLEERDYAQRGTAGGAPTAGDLSAIFKDTSLGTQRPDFNSFLKKGDERLKLLEQVDRLPDLQSDFTASQYKMVFKKSRALSGGLRPDQISPQKLRELLEEMERLGRKGGGNWNSDVSEGMEALEYGQQDRAMQAMEKALNKLRAMEEGQRGGRGLRGGRESDRGGERGRGSGGAGPDEGDFGEGEGLMPGRGKSGSPKGDPTQRLRANPYDVGVEGETRRGRKEGFDTNLTGRAGRSPSRLTYMGVIGQYRKAMEDALTREQVPRDYHEQIKDYFQALDER